MLMYKLNWKACYLIRCRHPSFLQTHTHTHTHIQTHTLTHTHRHTQTHTHTDSDRHTYTHTRSHTHKNIPSNSCQARALHWTTIRMCQLLPCSPNRPRLLSYYHLLRQKNDLNCWNSLCGWSQTRGLANNNSAVHCRQRIDMSHIPKSPHFPFSLIQDSVKNLDIFHESVLMSGG